MKCGGAATYPGLLKIWGLTAGLIAPFLFQAFAAYANGVKQHSVDLIPLSRRVRGLSWVVKKLVLTCDLIDRVLFRTTCTSSQVIPSTDARSVGRRILAAAIGI